MNVASVGTEAYAKSLTAGMLQLNNIQGAKPLETGNGGFQEVFAQAIDQTIKLQGEANAEKIKFLTGESDDLHRVMITGEKASLAFQLTLQVRNKMVEAYQEVMRMQV